MKNLLTFFITGFFVFSFDVYSDDHYEELPNISNVQVNVCKLKEGVSLKEYNAVYDEYSKTLISKFGARAHWGKNKDWIFSAL